MKKIERWPPNLVCLAVVITVCHCPVTEGAIESCDPVHAFLLSNNTATGATLTYTNTRTCDTDTVTFGGRYLPSQSVCGERNGRCKMSSISNFDGNKHVIVFPLEGGLDLVSYLYANSTFVFSEKQFFAQNVAGCTVAFIIPFPLSSSEFIGYCLDLSGHMIDHIFIDVNFETLSNSRVYRNNFYPSFSIQSNSSLSDFLYISNSEFCFSTDNGHVVFLDNGDLLDHSLDDAEYINHGNIGVPACSVSQPRLQRLGSECKLAAYCNGTTAVFSTPERFTGSEQVIATEENELVFVCSSSHYVIFTNKTLSVREISSGEQIGNSFPLNSESILLGDCLLSEEQFYFVAVLDNNSVVFVDFNTLTSYSLAESLNDVATTPYLVQDELLFVNNGAHSLVLNWTRISESNFSSLPISFDLVLSFNDGSTSNQCGCVGEDLVAMTTEPVVDNTTTTLLSTGTDMIAITTITDPSPRTTSGDGTTTESPSSVTVLSTTESPSTVTVLSTTESPSSVTVLSVLSVGEIVGIIIAVMFMLILLVIILALSVWCFVRVRRNNRSNSGGGDIELVAVNQIAVNPANTNTEKEALKEENFINNENDYPSIVATNNNEQNQQGPPPDPGSQSNSPTSAPLNQDGQTEVEVHQEEETSFVNLTPQNESVATTEENSTQDSVDVDTVSRENIPPPVAETSVLPIENLDSSREEAHIAQGSTEGVSDEFPVTTDAVSQQNSPIHNNNSLMLVNHSPPTSGLSFESTHPDNLTSRISVDEPRVNAVHKDTTDVHHDSDTSVLVVHPARHPIRPHADAVDNQNSLMEQLHSQRYGNDGRSSAQ